MKLSLVINLEVQPDEFNPDDAPNDAPSSNAHYLAPLNGIVWIDWRDRVPSALAKRIHQHRQQI
jgi:hypothetical protein